MTDATYPAPPANGGAFRKGSIAQREQHANAIAAVTAEILMAQACSVEQFRAWAATVPHVTPSWVAYELTSATGAWWVGHLFFIEDAWRIVARANGMDGDDFRPLRPLFVDAFDAECARRVRLKFNLGE
jgi:hypothetical protein